MEKQFDDICERFGVHPAARDLLRHVYKAGFDAGIETAEQKFDEEFGHIAAAAAALEC